MSSSRGAPAQSDAYSKLMAKAQILAKKTGVSEAVAFSKIYTVPENGDLVQADKAFDTPRWPAASLPSGTGGKADYRQRHSRRRGRRPYCEGARPQGVRVSKT
jgi:hypothetical protein